MWLIIKNIDDTTFQVLDHKPPNGAYSKEHFTTKYWDGLTPRKESYDLDTGETIPGDKDPTLIADYVTRRRLAYLEAGLTANDLMNLLYDEVLPALKANLPTDVQVEIDTRLDTRQVIKDEIPVNGVGGGAIVSR